MPRDLPTILLEDADLAPVAFDSIPEPNAGPSWRCWRSGLSSGWHPTMEEAAEQLLAMWLALDEVSQVRLTMRAYEGRTPHVVC